MAEENSNPTPEDVTPDPRLLVDDSTREFFETYVGPGKKYANLGELAKGYAHADHHIAELTKDSGQFKTEAESLRELLMEQIVENNKPKDEPIPNQPPNEDEPLAKPPVSSPPKEDKDFDLKALVKEALGEVSADDRRKENARITEEATVKQFGSKEAAVEAIAKKAQELEVSPQWIANLAFDSPKAYFATMDLDPNLPLKSTSTPAPNSDVDGNRLKDANPGTKPNSYKFYRELRRTDPRKWRSQEIQQAILKDAAENPNFYDGS
jgi:hypothetical protein